MGSGPTLSFNNNKESEEEDNGTQERSRLRGFGIRLLPRLGKGTREGLGGLGRKKGGRGNADAGSVRGLTWGLVGTEHQLCETERNEV